jgi:hypothetical protein
VYYIQQLEWEYNITRAITFCTITDIDIDRCASYLDLYLEIDSEGRLKTKFYDKRDDLNALIVNFPFICSNIPELVVPTCLEKRKRYRLAALIKDWALSMEYHRQK